MIAQHLNDHAVQGAFRALADPTRREILLLLSEDDMTIGDVADRFEITRAAVKKHLTILQEGRLISVQPRGRQRINRLEPLALKRASDWLNYFDRFWDERLSALHKAIEHDNPDDADLHPPKSSKRKTAT
uniref:ArsR/SmtB family transcription factor n=1 Tax=Pararhizobium sp. IMCC3301 TaxID=3067904 RepID=UPI00274111C4|nr:metalloregulator ArsR/SmtB family transcription factor [Pararhizobium sp. IMCC3301]